MAFGFSPREFQQPHFFKAGWGWGHPGARRNVKTKTERPLYARRDWSASDGSFHRTAGLHFFFIPVLRSARRGALLPYCDATGRIPESCSGTTVSRPGGAAVFLQDSGVRASRQFVPTGQRRDRVTRGQVTFRASSSGNQHLSLCLSRSVGTEKSVAIRTVCGSSYCESRPWIVFDTFLCSGRIDRGVNI